METSKQQLEKSATLLQDNKSKDQQSRHDMPIRHQQPLQGSPVVQRRQPPPIPPRAVSKTSYGRFSSFSGEGSPSRQGQVRRVDSQSGIPPNPRSVSSPTQKSNLVPKVDNPTSFVISSIQSVLGHGSADAISVSGKETSSLSSSNKISSVSSTTTGVETSTSSLIEDSSQETRQDNRDSCATSSSSSSSSSSSLAASFPQHLPVSTVVVKTPKTSTQTNERNRPQERQIQQNADMTDTASQGVNTLQSRVSSDPSLNGSVINPILAKEARTRSFLVGNLGCQVSTSIAQ